MKFLYPIKKLNIKPWIKYWVLKKTSGESTLKAVTLSEGTLTKVDKSKALSIKEYYGNAIQNGTPSPEAPVPVNVVKGNNTIKINDTDYQVNLKSKNLLNIMNYTNSNFNTTTYVDIANYMKIKSRYGIATDFQCGNGFMNATLKNQYDNSQSVLFYNLKPNTQYTISCVLSTNVESGNIQIFGKTAIFSETERVNTFTTNSSGEYEIQTHIYIQQTKTSGLYVNLSNIQLEEGSEATTYEPYYEYELCKIGNYQDKLYYDSGKWYIEKQVGKVVLNGSENWQQNSAQTLTNTSLFHTSVIDNYVDISKTCLCNYFIRKQIWSVDEEGIYFYTGWSSLRIRIKTSLSSNVANFKTWLSTHNTTVYYVLATPITTEITDTNLILQLNALYEFYVQSSTVSISNDSEIPFEFLLEYYGR